MSNNKSENQEQQMQQEPDTICPIVDKHAIITKLETLAQETGDIAGYIDVSARYGRASGYVEGKHTAYMELAYIILEGEFDPVIGKDGCDGYEM